MGAKKVPKPSDEVLAKVRSLKGRDGDVAVIEPKSGKYFINKNLTFAMREARSKFPGKVFYCLRLGSISVHMHKGIARTAKKRTCR
jgi:hypothetical protein